MTAEHRTISTLTNGHVAVFMHAPGSAVTMREYRRRGNLVYLLRDGHPEQPICKGLSTQGRPLAIAPRATLEDTIRRELDEQEGVRGPAWAWRLSGVIEKTFIGVTSAAVIGAWLYSIVSLVHWNS